MYLQNVVYTLTGINNSCSGGKKRGTQEVLHAIVSEEIKVMSTEFVQHLTGIVANKFT